MKIVCFELAQRLGQRQQIFAVGTARTVCVRDLFGNGVKPGRTEIGKVVFGGNVDQRLE